MMLKPSIPSPEYVEKRRQEAIRLLDTWGEFIPKKQAIREIVDKPELQMSDYWTLGSLLRDVRAKFNKMQGYGCSGTKVDWPDPHVVHAVKVLTALDRDHASDANSLGWSRSTSSVGHWCHGMLSIDREKALSVARYIVGKHKRQIESEPVTLLYPLPQDWRF